jgi:hypothetical protein
MSHGTALSLTPNNLRFIVGKRNWDKETSSSSLGTFATNFFFRFSCCSTSNRLSFTLFARERGFTATAVLLVINFCNTAYSVPGLLMMPVDIS